MNNQEEKAIELVRTSRVEKEPTEISIRSGVAAFDGTIYIMHWKSKKEDREFDSLAYFRVGSEDPVFLWPGEEAIRYFSTLKPAGIVERIARYAFSLSGISAIIALLITVTICYMVVTGTAEVPGILANALTIILGFFFGSEVAKKKE